MHTIMLRCVSKTSQGGSRVKGASGYRSPRFSSMCVARIAQLLSPEQKPGRNSGERKLWVIRPTAHSTRIAPEYSPFTATLTTWPMRGAGQIFCRGSCSLVALLFVDFLAVFGHWVPRYARSVISSIYSSWYRPSQSPACLQKPNPTSLHRPKNFP